ncbi:unnamed protein product [Amoebophrya sp. A120]|nr:unnamed protein product [Amoebophrya sp. A120]|eukprot:GSA120T00003686001.1
MAAQAEIPDPDSSSPPCSDRFQKPSLLDLVQRVDDDLVENRMLLLSYLFPAKEYAEALTMIEQEKMTFAVLQPRERETDPPIDDTEHQPNEQKNVDKSRPKEDELGTGNRGKALMVPTTGSDCNLLFPPPPFGFGNSTSLLHFPTDSPLEDDALGSQSDTHQEDYVFVALTENQLPVFPDTGFCAECHVTKPCCKHLVAAFIQQRIPELAAPPTKMTAREYSEFLLKARQEVVRKGGRFNFKT